MINKPIRFLLTTFVASYALSANALEIYTDRTEFLNAIDGIVFIDDFSNPLYSDTSSAADWKSLSSGNIGYESTGHFVPDWNRNPDGGLCWGCNGSGQILLDDTLLGRNGVVAFGLDIRANQGLSGTHYDAGVTYGDGSTEVFKLPFKAWDLNEDPSLYAFFGIIDTNRLISNVHFGPNGFGTTTSSPNIVVDNVTIGEVPIPVIIEGGPIQECAREGGSLIDFSVEMVPTDTIIIEWLLDGVSTGYGEYVTTFVPLGIHSMEARVTTERGYVFNGFSIFEIVDTISPDISISFTNQKGATITSISRGGLNYVNVNYNASDVCDANPNVTAIGGVSVDDGDVLRINASIDDIIINGDVFILGVTATDGSGNIVKKEANLIITP